MKLTFIKGPFKSATPFTKAVLLALLVLYVLHKRVARVLSRPPRWTTFYDFLLRIDKQSRFPLSFKFGGTKWIVTIGELPLLPVSMVQGVYEAAETKLINKVKPRTFIDVGAHVGYYTFLAARNGAERVLAIEPDPRTYSILVRNVKVNNLGKAVRPCPLAAYSANDFTLTFYLSEVSTCSSLTIKPRKAIGERRVKTVTLDSLIKRVGLDQVDFVKIDVEGAELEVLCGAERLLSEVRPRFILVEILHENRARVLKFMLERGYVAAGPFTSHSRSANYLFVPKEIGLKL